jgi:hypothetical protein
MAASGAAFRPEEPNVARMYDYMLGGKDNFPADREAARRTFDVLGEDVVRGTVAQNRRFLGRAVRHLAREAGIRQFLDIGTGLPTTGSVHEAAREVARDSRVVYVDNDPVVISHAGYTLHGVEGTAIVDHDLRDPAGITGDARVRSVLGFDQPIAVLLVAILHFVADADDPAGIVAALMDSVPPGSFLVISHLSADHYAEADKAADVYEDASSGLYLRSRAVVGSLFDGHPAGRLARRGVAVVRDRAQAVTQRCAFTRGLRGLPGAGGASGPPRRGRPGAGPSPPWRCCWRGGPGWRCRRWWWTGRDG